jgi:hypothetical protein
LQRCRSLIPSWLVGSRDVTRTSSQRPIMYSQSYTFPY